MQALIDVRELSFLSTTQETDAYIKRGPLEELHNKPPETTGKETPQEH